MQSVSACPLVRLDKFQTLVHFESLKIIKIQTLSTNIGSISSCAPDLLSARQSSVKYRRHAA